MQETKYIGKTGGYAGKSASSCLQSYIAYGEIARYDVVAYW